MFADSTTNTAMCRCSLLFWFFFFLCADTTWWLSWDPYAPTSSPADEATTSRKQLDPLPSQLSPKKEKRKKKEKNTQRRDSHTGTSVIHQHDQDFRTINHHGHHVKCPECCTGLMDPTENLNKIQQDILGLSAKLHQMTEDNSSWFGNLLQFQPGKIITRKNFTDPNCMFCFCVSMQLHISNTEHVQCACNDYKLQELTFKCLNLYFVRVIRTLKGGIVELQIVFKCLT